MSAATRSTSLLDAIVAFDGDLDSPSAVALVLAALAELNAAIRVSLDVCDALDGGTNLPELLAAALSAIAEDVGGAEGLVRHRPGSWEADLVRRLGVVA